MRLDFLVIGTLAGLLLLAPGCNTGEGERGVSAKQRVMPKSGEVWGRDLSLGLGLEDWSLCNELGTYDCISDAHLITLGGVEPAVLGIDEPLANASVSAPIAADRVAIAACGERLARDEAGPAAVFGPVLEANTMQNRQTVSAQLVRRLLSRHPTDAEVDALVDLYPAISDISEDPARDWAIGACLMVATSTEALFY